MILESTTYPGTTDEVLQPMFEEKGFKLDEDFLLAFSPERVDPGNPQFQTHNIPKVVGGVSTGLDRDGGDALRADRRTGLSGLVGPRGRGGKLWENTFRAINIGMANEMAKLCNALGIDTWEVVGRPRQSRSALCRSIPGRASAATASRSTRIICHGRPVSTVLIRSSSHWRNRSIRTCPTMSSSSSATPLNEDKKAVNGSKILILGVAYKKDIDDMRESPALSIIDLLRADGADVVLSRPVRPRGDIRPRLHDRRRRTAL